MQLEVPDDLKQGLKDTQTAVSDAASTAAKDIAAPFKPLVAPAPSAASTSDSLLPPVKLAAPAAAPAAVATPIAPAAPVAVTTNAGMKPIPAPTESSILPLKLSHDPSMLPSPNNSATLQPAVTAKAPAAEAEKPAASTAVKTTFPPLPAALGGLIAKEVTKDIAAEIKVTQPAKKLGAKARSGRKVASASKPRYRNMRLPATIYMKKYDRQNKHLPTAHYETDMSNYLFNAVAQDNINGIRALLDYSKRDINSRSSRGETPLIVAVQNHSMNALHLLLGRRADTSVADAQGMTALDYAKQMGSEDMIKVLEPRTKARTASNQYQNDAATIQPHANKAAADGNARISDSGYASYSPITLAFSQ